MAKDDLIAIGGCIIHLLKKSSTTTVTMKWRALVKSFIRAVKVMEVMNAMKQHMPKRKNIYKIKSLKDQDRDPGRTSKREMTIPSDEWMLISLW